MKYFVRFLLLAAGFALTTSGLMLWQADAFSFEGIWRFSDRVHPIYFLIIGIAMIPPALWEIFLLENRDPRD